MYYVVVTTDGLCECGCGQMTAIATQTRVHLGLKKGQHRRFVYGHHLRSPEQRAKIRGPRDPAIRRDRQGRRVVPAVCPMCGAEFGQRLDGVPKTCSRSCARKKECQERGGHSPNYKGGRILQPDGYVRVLAPDHPQ